MFAETEHAPRLGSPRFKHRRSPLCSPSNSHAGTEPEYSDLSPARFAPDESAYAVGRRRAECTSSTITALGVVVANISPFLKWVAAEDSDAYSG